MEYLKRDHCNILHAYVFHFLYVYIFFSYIPFDEGIYIFSKFSLYELVIKNKLFTILQYRLQDTHWEMSY